MSKRILIGSCLLLLLGLVQIAASPIFDINLRASPTPVSVGDTLTYTLVVSNQIPTLQSGVTIQENLPAAFTNYSILIAPVIPTTNGNTLTFAIGTMVFTQSVTIVIRGTAGAAGAFNNSVLVTSTTTIPPGESTNLVTIVSVPGEAKIEGGISSDPANVFIDDSIAFSVQFTNTGNAISENVVITNLFSMNVLLRSVTPSNLVSTFNGNQLLLSAGTLSAGGSGSFNFVVQPTNSGPLITTATFSGSDLGTNTIQSSTATNFVSAPDTNMIAVSAVPDQIFFDPQTGLVRQTVQVTNGRGTNINSVRVIVMGLGTNRLYYATGMNADNPFVVFAADLPPDATTNLVLEYFIPSRQKDLATNFTFVAYDANAPAAIVTPGGETIEILRVLPLPPDRLLLEFTSQQGASYAIVYSDNASFTNSYKAQPAIVAPANRTQWIDDGPPKTISRLDATTNRFYRVIKQ